VPPVARATGEIGYVRLHGRNRENWWGKGERGGATNGSASGAANGTSHGSMAAAGAKPRSMAASYGPLFAVDASAEAESSATGEAPPKPGPSGMSSDRYDYLYSETELSEWVQKIRELSTKAKKTFVFFNNCHVGQAATGAKLMRRLLEGDGLL
jgi:uncharacterized protein YecE (DUF72 family)